MRRGTVTDDLKLKIYPAVIGVLGICLVASLLFNVEIQVQQGVRREEVSSLDTELDTDLDTESDTELNTAPPSIEPETSPVPIPSPVPTAEAQPPISTPGSDTSPLADPEQASSTSSIGVDAQGVLRVSNQTEYPLRVALLHRQGESVDADVSLEAVGYGQPVHWDFAPGEGKTKGLILSLPNDNLQLQPGDVLVAFAQDGSRRYWGPYVVGETSSPIWNAGTKEWQLILQP